MKLSKKTTYALAFAIDLATLPDGRSRSVGEIAKRHKLSEKYLWVVASMLAKAGLLVSVRGPSGGFRLARRPAAIPLTEIIEACEGPVGGPDPDEATSRDRATNAVLADAWKIVASAWRTALASLTLEWLADQYRVRSGRPDFDFQI